MRHRRLGPERPGRSNRDAAAAASAPDRRGRATQSRAHPRRRQAHPDRRRRWRSRRGRGSHRAVGGVAGPGARLSAWPRRHRRPQSVQRHAAARPRIVGGGRRHPWHRHAHADAGARMGRRSRPQDRAHRHQSGRDHPPRPAERGGDRRCRRRGEEAPRRAAPFQPEARLAPRRDGTAAGADGGTAAQDRAAACFRRCDPRRAAGGRHLCRRGDADRLRRTARFPGLQATHVPVARLSGQSRLGLRHRARRAGCAARRAGRLDQRRRRFHVYRQRACHRDPPPHSAHRRGVRRRGVRQCAAHPAGALRQPADRLRPRQSGFREIRRELRRRRPPRPRRRRAADRADGILRPPRADPDRGSGRRVPQPVGIHPHAARARSLKVAAGSLIGAICAFNGLDHDQRRTCRCLRAHGAPSLCHRRH